MRRALEMLLSSAVAILILVNTITLLTPAVSMETGQASSTTMYPAATLFSETSGLKKRGPIMIYGDWGFTRDNGVVAGSGTADDPYIIEGWEIDASGYSHGIYIANTRAHFIIRNCKIYGADGGISLVNVANGKIIGNNIIGNGDGILLWNSSNNTIEYNNITNNRSHGIDLRVSSSNVIAGNNFIGGGLFVSDSYNNTVLNNTVNGKPLVYLENTRDQIISGNAGQVILVNCSNITVENLDISNTIVGIELWRTNNSVIKYNNIANNHVGIYLYSSSNNIIEYNNIANNPLHGLVLDSSSSNTIEYNNIMYCDIGIALESSSNNTIAGNNFINNHVQVYSSFSTNTWDLGYPEGGNYWSDHKCRDRYSGLYQNETGIDGICDTSYPIYDEGYNSYQYDHYPLAKPADRAPPITTTPAGEAAPPPLVLVAASIAIIAAVVVVLLLRRR